MDRLQVWSLVITGFTVPVSLLPIICEIFFLFIVFKISFLVIVFKIFFIFFNLKIINTSYGEKEDRFQ